MFKRKNKDFTQIMQKSDRFCIERMTYDVWNKHTRSNSFTEYEKLFVPNNALEYITRVMCGMKHNILSESQPDTKIYQTVIDDEYYQWLGKAPDTEESIASYIDHYNDSKDLDEITDKIIKNNFNVSVFNHGFIIIGQFENEEIESKLSEEVKEKIKDYINFLIDDDSFEVYVAPYFMTIADYMENYDRLYEIANVYFTDKKTLKYGKFETAKTDEEELRGVIVIPFSVREVHTDGCVTVKDVREYAESTTPKVGRSLSRIMTDEIGTYDLYLLPRDKRTENARQWFHDSDAFKQLEKDFEGKFKIDSVLNCFIPSFGVRDFLLYVVSFFKKQAKVLEQQEAQLKKIARKNNEKTAN